MFAQTEKLYFLHIPRTAGTSLRFFIFDIFAVDDFLNCHHLEDLERVGPAQLKRARLYSGHFGTRLWELLANPPLTLTLLRNPLERACSEMRYLRTWSEVEVADFAARSPVHRSYIELVRAGNPLQVLNSHAYIGAFANTQVRYLGGVPPNNELTRVAGPVYDRARKTLEDLHAFGIVEQMPESLAFFCEQFCWPPRQMSLRMNQAPAVDTDEFVGALSEVIPSVLEHNSWDLRLYDFARELFQDRFAGLCSRLGVASGRQSGDDAGTSTLSPMLLERFLATPFSGIPLRRGQITQAAGLFLDGWAERVYWPPVKRWLRWSSGQGTSSLYLPLDRTADDIILRFELFYPSAPNLPQQLRLFVDGREVELERMGVQQDSDIFFYLLEAILPGTPLSTARRWTTLSFVAPSIATNVDGDVASAGPAPRFALANIDFV